MGTDIHTKLEVFVNGTWAATDGPGFTEPKYNYNDAVGEPIPDGTRPRGMFEAGRSYALFGVLADVRNHSQVPPLKEPAGFPEDMAPESAKRLNGLHSPTWYTLHELLVANWDAPCEDRRYAKHVSPRGWDGGATAEPGEGVLTTYAKHIGPGYLADIELLRAWAESQEIEPEHVRVIMAFDS